MPVLNGRGLEKTGKNWPGPSEIRVSSNAKIVDLVCNALHVYPVLGIVTKGLTVYNNVHRPSSDLHSTVSGFVACADGIILGVGVCGDDLVLGRNDGYSAFFRRFAHDPNRLARKMEPAFASSGS